MKGIIIGASLSGKTTVVKYLRSDTNIRISEIDEELTVSNGGKYPTDAEKRHKKLVPRIIRNLLNKENILFFTNTDYFSLDDLREARNKGFKILLLELSLNELRRRNKERVNNEGYEDLGRWLEGMVGYQEKVKNSGLVDLVIDANQPVEKIAEGIQGALVS
ncbi:MAG: hypothetical protein FJZ16_09540 [Candidatus Omnitrophica bacterium]|nr:hypothetical protein [Candidatus Omnitrophota bacterium]